MFEKITPEKAGISSVKVLEFMKIVDEYAPGTHSVIMARGGKIFHECYYAPFHKDFKHRMYSVTKSFMAMAIGLLIEEGKLSFEDKFVDLYPEYLGENKSELLAELTIRDMLTMETASSKDLFWFLDKPEDRCTVYAQTPCDKIPGTLFDYDSPGSFMLGTLVERITGKTFFEFLKERFLDDIGFSQDAYCLTAPGGYAWSDSGIMCTTRDMLIFAQFVMNKGVWNGKRYINEKFMNDATSKQVDNNPMGIMNYDCCGYGYQIWIGPRNTFFFNGMGGQLAICVPDKDLIFAINADVQGNPSAKQMVYYGVMQIIAENLSEQMSDDEKAYGELTEYCKDLKLYSLKGNTQSDFAKEINGVTYSLEKNPMNIEKIRFDFEGNKGKLRFCNATGEKELCFGMGYNEFGKFPEDGYSDVVGSVAVPGNKYDCACSAIWAEPQKLQIKVQIIDKYFGNGTMTFGFKDNRVGICMAKNAEAFLCEYEGVAIGHRE